MKQANTRVSVYIRESKREKWNPVRAPLFLFRKAKEPINLIGGETSWERLLNQKGTNFWKYVTGNLGNDVIIMQSD